MTADSAKPVPRATYRLQFTEEFGFRAAADLAPYLALLGVSHVYASPYLAARPGSSHGYDIVDHTRLNPDLGSEEDFAAMVAAFRAHGLGQVLDFVPNHMGVGGADNPWWLDVLEWGPASAYSGWFDIDWRAGKLLIPVLGDQYGQVLESGGLRLKFEPAEGAFAVWAYDTHKLPVRPADYGRILGEQNALLARLGDAFAHVGDSHPYQHRRARELKAELASAAAADPTLAAAIQRALERFTGTEGDLDSWRRLDALVRDQHWRAAHFRVAADEINYRRFFNINELAGVRMEHEELFDHAHGLIFRLLDEGVLDGIRIDHIDGLLDPKTYCRRLRERAPRPFYLLVEKILAQHEKLRPDWEVDGTTGYEFTNLATGLLTDPRGEEALDACYAGFTGQAQPFAETVRSCKLWIMDNEMASELNVLAREAARIAASNPRSADFTRNLLHRALKAIVAAFPVYRTYVDDDGATATDRRDIDWAFAVARRADPALDGSVFDFLHRLMTGDAVAQPGSGFSRHDVVRFAMRVQQYSGPVMAKGLEDTAFYRFNRFLAANEVGGHPDRLGVSVSAFHETNLRRARETPHAMLATSTHDTKRGEDTRARLAVLAELADEWAAVVPLWSRMLRAGEAGSDIVLPPDRNDEYAFYQLLLGAWPPGLAIDDPEGLARFRERIAAAMLKAMREAKVHTTWAAPEPVYEDAVAAFIERALDGARAKPFLESFLVFQERVAGLGVLNSLVQTAIKLTVPGVPDIYRGAELWDFSLVDPDNRLPVDFALRQSMLRDDASRQPLPSEMLENWSDGRAKLALTRRLLAHRSSDPQLYMSGGYEALQVSGAANDAVIAYARRWEGRMILVALRRFPSRSCVDMPGTLGCALQPGDPDRWTDLVSGREVSAIQDLLPLEDILSQLPVAVFVPASSSTRRT